MIEQDFCTLYGACGTRIWFDSLGLRYSAAVGTSQWVDIRPDPVQEPDVSCRLWWECVARPAPVVAPVVVTPEPGTFALLLVVSVVVLAYRIFSERCNDVESAVDSTSGRKANPVQQMQSRNLFRQNTEGCADAR